MTIGQAHTHIVS